MLKLRQMRNQLRDENFPVALHAPFQGAFQFLYLMQFMFFLSGLFVWPSLRRKGLWGFVAHRLVRLGIPFVIGVYLVMPIVGLIETPKPLPDSIAKPVLQAAE